MPCRDRGAHCTDLHCARGEYRLPQRASISGVPCQPMLDGRELLLRRREGLRADLDRELPQPLIETRSFRSSADRTTGALKCLTDCIATPAMFRHDQNPH
jgi:hypothetical protein